MESQINHHLDTNSYYSDSEDDILKLKKP